MRVLPCLAFAACLAGAPAAAAPAFRIALIGGVGYSEQNAPLDHETHLRRLLEDLNAQPVAFIVHNGDAGHPRELCQDDALLRRHAQLQAVQRPLIFTPGDNEWFACRDERDARLARVREVFFATDKSLGQLPMTLARQSAESGAYAKYSENARWQLGDVTFFTIHLVGGGNNAGRPEAIERDRANRAWITASFAAAKAAGSKAVMLFTRANVFPNGGVGIGYTENFFEVLFSETVKFGAPVVLVHGDGNKFLIDKPFTDNRERVLETFTRVQTFGTPDHHWIEAIVDYDNPNVFEFRARVVKANLAP
jgi:hypothetical protein